MEATGVSLPSTETPAPSHTSETTGKTVPTQETGPYSTLEVHHGRFVEHEWNAAPNARPRSTQEKLTYYDKDLHKEIVVTERPLPDTPDAPESPTQSSILGLRRKTFFFVLVGVVLAIVAAALGGGIEGAAAARRSNVKDITSSNSNSSTSTTTPYTNTGLAAMQWTDTNGTMYKRIYYQDRKNTVKESAWDNSTAFTTAWSVKTISDAVKPATPLAAVAGWPHASYNYTLVKNVYYMSPNDELVERQAKANDSQAWEDDNFTGLYSGSDTTSLTALWCQNIWNVSQELVVLFQEDNFENGITQARYTSANSSSNPWVANNFPFAQPKGSTFAMSLVSYRSGKHLMLYTVGDNDKLGQHEYTIGDSVDSTSLVSMTSESATPLTVDSRAPLAVVAQDNQPLYTTDTLPECTQQTPLTNLIFFATPDRSSLVLSAWNCTVGFEDHTAEISPLQKPNTTYLALAAMSDRATGDGDLYIMFDSGRGPEIEEWTVPKRAGDAWEVSRKVDVDFAL